MCMECTKDLITTFVFSRVTATFGVPFIERTIFLVRAYSVLIFHWCTRIHKTILRASINIISHNPGPICYWNYSINSYAECRTIISCI